MLPTPEERFHCDFTGLLVQVCTAVSDILAQEGLTAFSDAISSVTDTLLVRHDPHEDLAQLGCTRTLPDITCLIVVQLFQNA